MAVETIDLPVIGKTKTTWVYVGGAAVVGVVGYAWWTRNGQAPDTEGTVGQTLYDEFGNPLPTVEAGGDYRPPVIAPVTGDYTDESRPGPPVSNSEWAQRASEYLIEHFGYDAGKVGDALGRYLARSQLNDQVELGIVQAAVGVMGTPPIGGYSIIAPGPLPPSKDKPGPVGGLRVTKATKGGLTFSWNPTAGDYYFYKLIAGAPPNIKEQARGITRATSKTITGLRPNSPYRFEIRAERRGIGVGPWASIVGRTTR